MLKPVVLAALIALSPAAAAAAAHSAVATVSADGRVVSTVRFNIEEGRRTRVELAGADRPILIEAAGGRRPARRAGPSVRPASGGAAVPRRRYAWTW